jgi:hypothetical protein
VLLHAASGGRRSAKEAGGEGDEPIGVAEHDVEHGGVGIPGCDRDFDGGCGLACLSARDGDRGSPRRARLLLERFG